MFAPSWKTGLLISGSTIVEGPETVFEVHLLQLGCRLSQNRRNGFHSQTEDD